MLRLILSIPERFIFMVFSRFIKSPHGAITILRPSPVPYSAISKISDLAIGSPPVRIMMGLAKEETFSRTLKHSSVVNSPGNSLSDADALQCLQFRLHLFVTSQAISLG